MLREKDKDLLGTCLDEKQSKIKIKSLWKVSIHVDQNSKSKLKVIIMFKYIIILLNLTMFSLNLRK